MHFLTVPTKVSLGVILSEAKDLTFRKAPGKSRSFASLRMTQEAVLPDNGLLSVSCMFGSGLCRCPNGNRDDSRQNQQDDRPVIGIRKSLVQVVHLPG